MYLNYYNQLDLIVALANSFQNYVIAYHSFHVCQKILLDLVLLFALSNSCFGGTWLSIRVWAIVWLVMGSWKDRFNWEYISEKRKSQVVFILKRHPQI